MLPSRSIPACTGKPCADASDSAAPAVYPRVYGEACESRAETTRTPGLSPRVRGSLAISVPFYGGVGSIPACTGKPMVAVASPSVAPVYPRVYGEASSGQSRTKTITGLSPRVRGSLLARAGWCTSDGSIPACTGKPDVASGGERSIEVYPRVYGEATARYELPLDLTGLSPRVRGSPAGRLPCHAFARSIPACTGKPAAQRARVFHHAVYPRVYGEAIALTASHSRLKGLSPRVRGSPATAADLVPLYRSIPACTGKPPPQCHPE